MNNSQYVHICIGIMLGFVFTSVIHAIQPRTIHHHVSLNIDKPIEAKLDIEAVDNCMVKGNC